MSARETALADTLAVARVLAAMERHTIVNPLHAYYPATVVEIANWGPLSRRMVASRLRSGSVVAKAIAGQGHAVLFKFDQVTRRWSLTAAGRALVEGAK